MCHNHSHLKAGNIALTIVGDMPVVLIHLSQAVTVELPDGTRLKVPSSSTLFVPSLTQEDSSPWQPPPMGEQFAFIASAMALCTTSADTAGDESRR